MLKAHIIPTSVSLRSPCDCICPLSSLNDVLNGCHCKLMKAGCRRMLYLACFVTGFLLPGLGVVGCLGRPPGERRICFNKLVDTRSDTDFGNTTRRGGERATVC